MVSVSLNEMSVLKVLAIETNLAVGLMKENEDEPAARSILRVKCYVRVCEAERNQITVRDKR